MLQLNSFSSFSITFAKPVHSGLCFVSKKKQQEVSQIKIYLTLRCRLNKMLMDYCVFYKYFLISRSTLVNTGTLNKEDGILEIIIGRMRMTRFCQFINQTRCEKLSRSARNLSLCRLHFLHFYNAIGGMKLICYKCFGTLNQGMEFLEFKLVIYIKNLSTQYVFSILNNCYRKSLQW